MNDKRLIEVAFPLKQTSIASVHEKNVRHGHISTLHIWPARRPLAASRAALIATLLPDPGDKQKRDEILKRMGGTLKKTLKKKKMPNGRIEEIEAWDTQGGVLAWGRENGPDMEWFGQEIRKAYGGRAPRVLDPFAGGGAIPLEAMRLGCEVTAIDINPVAWFILKCTLEYPQRLASEKHRLPDFALADVGFLTNYFKSRGLQSRDAEQRARQVANKVTAAGGHPDLFGLPDVASEELDAELAWHVRAWGHEVLRLARRELARFYPAYAEYCSLRPYHRVALDRDEPMKLVPVNDAGEPQIELLHAGVDADYLANPANPRWVIKPTVAYLWARTVRCKACRAQVPLLKTRWLAKKDDKRVLLTMHPNEDKTGVVFGIDPNPPIRGGNAAQKREHDRKLGAGTMSRAGATCPCCGTIMTMEDLRLEGRAGRTGTVMTAVVVDGPAGKEYRLPTAHEIECAQAAAEELPRVFQDVPFGLPTEPIDRYGKEGGSYGFPIVTHGIDKWHKLFTPRQLLALGVFVRAIRAVLSAPSFPHAAWREAVGAYLAVSLDRLADYSSTICLWALSEFLCHTFTRFALPISWDFVEGSPTGGTSGNYLGAVDWIARFIEHALTAAHGVPQVLNASVIQMPEGEYDLIVTDPPYYDAIPYSDLMDFFYVWLRRSLHGLSPEYDAAFAAPLAPKWDRDKQDGELIDDASRFGGDKAASKKNYEDGMARAFASCHAALRPEGRLVIVFAHKQPDAWETLVSAIIRAGFVVDGSWPIQTERETRMRAYASAALSSSVWLVCKKRDPLARAGWDTQVLKEMQANITERLRAFWDAGIRGPDFLWAATGPALEAFSRYPAVKKASEPGALMSVTEFLGHVRRIVVDFVVGRVLTQGASEPTPGDHPLDDVTTYYLLHRNDFGLKEAPAGPCILYAVSCGLSERELVDQYDLLIKSGGKAKLEEEDTADGDEDAEGEETSGSGGGGQFKLKDWRARKHRTLGMETVTGRTVPLIDQVHKLMQLWAAGDVVKVNDYLDARGLRRSQVFAKLIQALIEKSRAEGCAEECSILERVQNYLRSLGATAQFELTLGDGTT